MTKEEFIVQVITYLKKYAPQYNIKCYSAVCAQFCLESGFGTSNKVYKDGEWRHNYVGLKWRDNRLQVTNDYFSEWTAEQNKDGSYTNIESRFFKFRSLEECVIGYLQFINISNYANLKGVTTPRQYLENIKTDKYATSLDYVDKCMKVVDQYNLIQYDPKETTSDNIEILRQVSTSNTTSCSRIPKYIVIHYTAGTNSKSGTAKNIANYFAKTTTKASADFIVDDGMIVQYNPDPTKYYCWAVGGKKYSAMTTNLGGRLYGIATNSNCINIEMCSSKTSTKTLSATDTDWYITDATQNNAIKLTKYLMGIYDIPIENVIMHHEVTGKICPNPFCISQSSLALWNAFKGKIDSKNVSTTTSTTTTNTALNSQNTSSQGKFMLNGLDYSLVFNPSYYATNYTDLKKAFGTNEGKLWKHFIDYGMKEGRRASSNFVLAIYKSRYQDLNKAFGNDNKKYYEHYVRYGHKEGRSAV